MMTSRLIIVAKNRDFPLLSDGVHTRPKRIGRPAKYPLREMALGETVFVPGATQSKINKVRSIYKPMKFRVRAVVSGGVEGVRIWRIA